MEECKWGSWEPFWEQVQDSRKEICHCHLESSRAEERAEIIWAVRIGRTCWCIRNERVGRSRKKSRLERVDSPAISPNLEDYGRNSFENESKEFHSGHIPEVHHVEVGQKKRYQLKGAEIEGNSNKWETRKSKKRRAKTSRRRWQQVA